jgi:hypothetical protein
MSIRLSRSLLLLILFFALVVHCSAGAAPQDSSSRSAVTGGNVYPDAPSFAAELQRIGNAIAKEKETPTGIAALRETLPAHWEITTAEHAYTLSAEPLRTLLGDAEKEKNPQKFAVKTTEAAEWAFDLANQFNACAGAKANNAPSARPALERILSRWEFGSAHGPTKWDLFRQRVSRWIGDLVVSLFRQIFRQVGRHPIGANILFWFIVVAVVLWLAMTLFRFWSRRTAMEELQAPDSVAFARTWQEWVHAARDAATHGDFREAIHSAYWAGISYLEASEVVRKDRTRTPREYVRLVSTSTQFVASGRKTREALSSLTTVLEQVWYGRRAASNQDFANAMQNVEALGCQLQ